MTDYGSILKNLGYQLTDRGHYWQAPAVFREGDNKTALSIYKDTGVWTDFVEGEKPLPFELLLKKTLKVNDVSHILFNNQFNYKNLTKEYLSEEKTFSEKALTRLLPHYDFFEEKGISVKTQKCYKCGLATNGKLYQRIVFPIYRKDGKIHGFSGRKVIETSDRPKWLHYGRSADWFYPYFSINGVSEQIREENRIFVVESIGDSMALYQSGVKNNCVAFNNKLNKKLIARLAALGVDIVLSFNNDEGKNRGFDGALTSIVKLLDTVDLNKIYFYPPHLKGDFGEMGKEQIAEWRRGFENFGHKESCENLLNYFPSANIPKTTRAKLPKLKKEMEELHGKM